MPEHRAPTTTKLPIRALLVVGIIMAVAAASMYYNDHRSLFANITTRQPTRYTELYFNNPTSLPGNVPGGSTLPVSFTVHNFEARSMQYAITVSLIGSGQTLAAKQPHITLASAASKSITIPLVVPAAYHGNANVAVTLDNLHQSIHFKVRVP